MAEKRKPLPKGWLEVSPYVAGEVQDAINALAPGLSFTDTDAWGAGISPRMVQMIRTLATPGARVGPTSVEALRKMLVSVDDRTYALLGGNAAEVWAFAPKEFEELAKLHDQGADKERLNEAGEAARKAADAAAETWLASHTDDDQ
jgi:hypothetical protein